jgi:hypothetical protein
MIRSIIFMLTLTITSTVMGQCFMEQYSPPFYFQSSCQSFYSPPIYMESVDYTYFRLNGMMEQSRAYETIEYGNSEWVNVPIINGFAPTLTRTNLPNGGRETIYDYSKRIQLSGCRVYGVKKTKTKTSNPDVLSVPSPEYKVIVPEKPTPVLETPEVPLSVPSPDFDAPALESKLPVNTKLPSDVGDVESRLPEYKKVD